MRVLVVQADPVERLRWEVALRERGHLAVSSRPGPEAWRHATAGGLDLIVAAHADGEGDARRLLAELRDAALPLPRPSLMVLLPEEESALLLTLLQDGADDVLIGRIEPTTLRLRLIAAERRLERRSGQSTATPLVLQAIEAPPEPEAARTAEPNPRAAEQLPDMRTALAEALDAAASSAANAYAALPADPGAARADLRLVLDALRAVQLAAEALLGPLPAHVEATAAPPAPRSLVPHSGERLLVVLADDDEHVRRPLRRTLEHAGLDVLEAADGESALRLILEHAARVRLVVTDHRMPRMTGAELVRELKRRLPHLPVVIVSGHGAQDIARDAGADAFLRKPFQLVELARTARRLIAPLAA